MDDNEIILTISGKQYPITGADKAAVLKSLLLVEERCTTGLIDVEGINVYLLKEQQKQAKIAALMKLLGEKGFSEEDVLQYLLYNSRNCFGRVLLCIREPTPPAKIIPILAAASLTLQNGVCFCP